METVVRARVNDDDSGFEAELRGLASTDMDTQWLTEFLNSAPAAKPWEIGEALAECVLEHLSGETICWPWNLVRDRRTPRASLPGADLVGFVVEGEEVWLLFGEVKSSSDKQTPPNVMYGEGGMTWQLEQEAISQGIQRTLLEWLSARCKEEPYSTYYRKATTRFISSQGKDFRLYGVLIRDTKHDEKDLLTRAEHLGEKVAKPGKVMLYAWYLPIPISDWPKVLSGGVK